MDEVQFMSFEVIESSAFGLPAFLSLSHSPPPRPPPTPTMASFLAFCVIYSFLTDKIFRFELRLIFEL